MIAWETTPMDGRQASVGEVTLGEERLKLQAVPEPGTEEMWRLSIVNANQPVYDLSALVCWMVFQGSEAQARNMLQTLARGVVGEMALNPRQMDDFHAQNEIAAREADVAALLHEIEVRKRREEMALLAREEIGYQLSIYHPDLDATREVNNRDPVKLGSEFVRRLRLAWSMSDPNRGGRVE
jgi:hypothetical protein